MKLLPLYLIAINLAAFVLMLVDKQRARACRWRVPEQTLFALAILGGSLGSIAGMYLFRHKTRHRSFTLGMPAILALQLALYLLLR